MFKRRLVRSLDGYELVARDRPGGLAPGLEAFGNYRQRYGLRHLTLAIGLFILAGVGFGAEPFEGTWKLDAGNTKDTQGAAPRELTVTIKRQADQLQFTNAGTDANGSPILLIYTAPIKGGKLNFVSARGPYNGGFQKRIDAYTREATYTRDGKVVSSLQGVVSKDRSSLTITVRGIDPEGRPVVGIMVFQK